MAEEDTQETPENDGEEQGQDEPLGEPGKRALTAEREARKAAEKAAKEYEQQLQELREQSMSDQERALEKARREAAEAARSEERGRLLGQLAETQVRAAASGVMANPALATKLLDVNDFLTDDGQVDESAVQQAVNKLVEDEPYLRASATRPVSADQGVRGAHAGSVATSDMNAMLRRAAGRA